MSKKILAALLAVLMVLTLVPMTALAADSETPTPDVNGVITVSTEDQLKAALTNESVKTIKLGENITGSTPVENAGGNGRTVFLVGRTVTLDLNGKTLDAAETSNAYTLAVNAEGITLTIINSATEKATLTNGTTKASSLEVVKGSLVIGDAETEANNNFIIDNNKNKGIKQNSAIKIEETATLVTMNGGEVGYAHAADADAKYDRSFQNFGKLVVNNGTINNDVQVWTYNTYKGSLVINGGTFEDDVYVATAEDKSQYTTYPLNGSIEIPANSTAVIKGSVSIRGAVPEEQTAEAKVTIASGTIKSVNASAGTFTITGGTFSSDPFSESTGVTAPAGYESKPSTGGKYTVSGIAVVPANLTAVDGQTAPTYGHAATYTAVLDATATNQINVTAVGLKKTKNSADEESYWVGIGLPHQDRATYATGWGAFDSSKADYKAPDNTQTTAGVLYDTLYWGGKDADFWNKSTSKTGYVSVKTSGGSVTNYTIKFDVKVAETTGIAAGFSWKAAEANTARNAAIKAANKSGTVTDSADQTVWFMVNEAAANNHYWYEITDGTSAIWEGALNPTADQRGMVAKSFLHSGQNPQNKTVPANLTINVWKTTSAVTTKPAGDPTATETISTGTNPLAIKEVAPSLEDSNVKVTFNQDLVGRYVIELTKNGVSTPVKTYGPTEFEAPTPAVALTTGHTFDSVEFAPGTYTVSIYPANAGTGHGKLISAKSFDLTAETITEITVDNPSLSAKVEGNKIVLTGSVPKKDDTFVLSYETSLNKTGTVDVDLQANDTGANWALDKIEGLFGKTIYALDASQVTFLAENVEVDIAAGKTEVKEVPASVIAAGSVAKAIEVETAVEKTAAEFDKNSNNLSTALSSTASAITEERAKTMLDKVNERLTDDEAKVSLEVVPYLDVEVKSYREATTDTPAELKLEVVPKIKIQAVKNTKNGKDEEPVIVQKDIPVNNHSDMGTVTITFTVPDSFGKLNGSWRDNLYVKHKNIYVYTAAVQKPNDVANGSYKFTNPHGFSEMVVSTENSIVATVGGVDYTSLQGAIDEVPTNGTIVLAADFTVPTTAPTINKNFEIDASAVTDVKVKEDLRKLLSTVSNVTATLDGNTIRVEYKSSSGNNQGGSINHPNGGQVDPNAPTVTIGVTQPENGTLSVEPKQAKAGEQVTVTVTPSEKYYVATSVTAKGDTTVTATKNANGTFTFTMPAGNTVIVTAEIKHIFDLFTDVPAGSFYADPVKWAVEQGITLGNSTDYSTFGTTASCTRKEMVLFLYRAAGEPAVTGSSNSFADITGSQYDAYRNAIQWAVDNGITQGTSEITFAPDDVCSRSQMVTFLYRYDKEPAVTGSNSFVDVPADAFYKTAVQWAVNKEVTQGTNAAGTTFEPYTACSRGQMVTFLYRYMGE